MQEQPKTNLTERLSGLYYLPGEIAIIKDDIDRLQSTGDPIWQETIALETARLDRCTKELEELISIIDAVEDPVLHKVLGLRYAAGLMWPQIALEMHGKHCESAYRQMVNRWARKMEEKDNA